MQRGGKQQQQSVGKKPSAVARQNSGRKPETTTTRKAGASKLSRTASASAVQQQSKPSSGSFEVENEVAATGKRKGEEVCTVLCVFFDVVCFGDVRTVSDWQGSTFRVTLFSSSRSLSLKLSTQSHHS